MPLRRNRLIWQALSIVVIVFFPAACTAWHASGPLPPQPGLINGGGAVRVTRADHTTIELRSAHATRDSLFGRARGDEVAMPLTDITRIELQRIDAGRTISLGAGVGVILAVAAGVALVAALGAAGANGAI
jgi:hypothetical protein